MKLEVDLACDLGQAARGCTSDLAEGTGCEVRGWGVELRVVEDVVTFHTKLERADTVTRQRDVLGDHDVDVVDAGSVIGVATDVAEASDWFCGKAGLIEALHIVRSRYEGPVVEILVWSNLQRDVRAGVEGIVCRAPQRM